MNQAFAACRLVMVAICFVAIAPVVAGEVEGMAKDLGSGVCPNSASVLSAVELQTRMTAVVTYLLGGTSPTTNFPCIDSSSAIAGLSTLQTLIRDGVCSLEVAPPTTVCGLKAGVQKLSCRRLTAADFRTIESIPISVDTCWKLGASGFFIIGGSYSATGDGYYDLSIAIDPEPARLTQRLSGDTGASAAAYYVNSKAKTSVVKWPATWTPNTSLAAGTPCSTVDLPEGYETTSTIQINGNYRKCMEASTPPPPESDPPVRLTEALSGAYGSSAAATYVNSGTATSVVKWPGTWTSNTTLSAGAPCSNVDLAPGAETTKTIQAGGNYRKCI